MAEIWKAISNYEGLYEVSNLGNVRSLRRNTTKGKILKLQTDKDGYFMVFLCKNNKKKKYSVHRLVAMAFVDGFSEEKNIVNHKNEIKNDNRAENLEWCDAKYNTNYNNMPYKRAEWRRKPIIAIKGNEKIEFSSIVEAASKLGVSHGNISGCLLKNKGRKTLKGYSFTYADAMGKQNKKENGGKLVEKSNIQIR